MILEELVSSLGLHVNESQWKAGERAVDGMKANLKSLGEMSGFNGVLRAGLASFVGYEALSNIKEMITGVIDLGSALNDTAQKTGLSVMALQFYGYVAKLNSADTEMLAGDTEKLAHTLNDVKDAANPAALALKDIGIKFNDPAFKNASMDDKLRIIAEHMAKLPDGAKKTADAIALFGRSGAQLIPTLNDLGKNGGALRAEFDALGGGLSGQQVAALDDFGDEIDKTKFSIGALKNSVVTDLLPMLKEMLHGFQSWIKANKGVIAQKLEKVITIVADAAKVLAKALLFVVDVIGFIHDHLFMLSAIVLTITGPFNSWMVLLTSIVVVVKAIWDAFADGKGPLAGVAKFVLGVINSVKDALKELKDFAKDVWSGITFVPRKIAGALGSVHDFLNGGSNDGTDPEHNPTTQQIFAGQGFQPPKAEVDNSMGGVLSRGSTQFNTPIQVNVNGGNPAEVQAAVKVAVQDAQKDMLRQAMNSVKGGKS
jgi:hypothetical protein